MAIATHHRHQVAREFFTLLAGGRDDGDLLELRYRLEDDHGMGQVFDRPSHVRGLATRALMLGRRTDVYVGCAPRTRRHGGRDAVSVAHALWADCDGDDAVAALGTFEPAPSIVISSGSGDNCHAYWPLCEPLAADEVEQGNRRLAHALGADPASADAARILRVPGTQNFKRLPPRAVEVVRFEIERRHNAVDVIGDLADPPQALASPPGRPVIAATGDDPLLSISPEVYVSRLLGVDVPRHRKVTCPFHEDRHPSLHVYNSPQRGWYCYGRCRRGGSIYDLAAPLYGYATTGDEFLALRGELQRLFGIEPR